MAKSSNKLNRIHCTAEPLGDELTNAIEEGEVTDKQEAKARSKMLQDIYEWNPNDAKKVWCFGPETTGPNLLVD